MEQKLDNLLSELHSVERKRPKKRSSKKKKKKKKKSKEDDISHFALKEKELQHAYVEQSVLAALEIRKKLEASNEKAKKSIRRRQKEVEESK